MGGGGVVFSDPLRPVAMSEVDRLLDPSTYSASNSYSVGALSAVFGREADTPSNLFPAIFLWRLTILPSEISFSRRSSRV